VLAIIHDLLPCPITVSTKLPFVQAPKNLLSDVAFIRVATATKYCLHMASMSCDILIELIPLIQVARAANFKLMQINMANVRDQVRNMQKVELEQLQQLQQLEQQPSHHYAVRISNECQTKDTESLWHKANSDDKANGSHVGDSIWIPKQKHCSSPLFLSLSLYHFTYMLVWQK